MKVTPDMFVVSVVLVVILTGTLILRTHVSKKSRDSRSTKRAFERDVFQVSWMMFGVAIFQFPIAALFLTVLLYSPKHDIAGYVIFGGLAAGWTLLGVHLLRYCLRSSVQFEDHQLVFCEGGRKSVLPYHELVSVDTSSSYIVCITSTGNTRVLIPMYFSGSAMILARLLYICRERDTQSFQTTPDTAPR